MIDAITIVLEVILGLILIVLGALLHKMGTIRKWQYEEERKNKNEP